MVPKIRFYADEHVPSAVVNGLRERGVDVLTVVEAGLLGASDAEHLLRCQADGRILITQDSDFLHLHARGMSHAGVVYAPHDTSIGEMIRGIMLIYMVLNTEEMREHVEYL